VPQAERDKMRAYRVEMRGKIKSGLGSARGAIL
jgi:hypothetical protein